MHFDGFSFMVGIACGGAAMWMLGLLLIMVQGVAQGPQPPQLEPREKAPSDQETRAW